MRPLLFYPNFLTHRNNDSHHKFLENLLGVEVGVYAIEEHRADYDHNDIPEYFPGTDILMPDTCWCEIPDPNNVWPQLYFNPQLSDNTEANKKESWTDKFKLTGWGPHFCAAKDDILLLKIEDIHKEYGTNITPHGDW